MIKRKRDRKKEIVKKEKNRARKRKRKRKKEKEKRGKSFATNFYENYISLIRHDKKFISIFADLYSSNFPWRGNFKKRIFIH